MGCSKEPGPPSAGKFPAFFLDMELSIFVDESGDFDLASKHSPYYIFTLVFHNQDKNIQKEIALLDQRVQELGYPKHAIHSEPLIRKEAPYENAIPEERKKIFLAIYHFTRKCPISYKSFVYLKRNYKDETQLMATMAKDLSTFISNHYDLFNKYDKVKVYYDNGQNQIKTILTVGLALTLSNVEFAKVAPKDYKLFQVADLICTIELLHNKLEAKALSNSEKKFFETKELKTYIKTIKNMQL